MREILFRGKRKDNGEWVESNCILQFKDGSVFFPMEYGNIEVIPETVRDFTSLTDKNGKKIFVGDIVTCDCTRTEHGMIAKGTILTVSFYRGAFVGLLLVDNQVAYTYLHQLCGAEVLGNILDNPELLKSF